MDARGRISDRVVVHALGWSPATRLTASVADGVVLVAADESGTSLVDAGWRVAVPAAVRRRCGVAVGERVLLAADRRVGRLVVCPYAVVDEALAAARGDVWGGGRR